MRKLIFILLISVSCSKDTIYNPIDDKCDCKIITYQVTINGIHIKQSELNINTDCFNDNNVFGEKYSNTRLIQYKKYLCD